MEYTSSLNIIHKSKMKPERSNHVHSQRIIKYKRILAGNSISNVAPQSNKIRNND